MHAADQLPLQTRSGYSSYTHDMRGVTIVSLLLRGGEKKKRERERRATRVHRFVEGNSDTEEKQKA